ncbi:MAG: RNA ligase partner protein, partial [Candidatus Hadarchaeota archaeon]
MRQRFILDTTAITDTGLRDTEGYETVCASTMDIMDLIARARLKLEISCYIPFPTVYGELTSFLRKSNCEDDVFLKLDTWVVKKTPNRYEVKVPAAIFHDYVLTVRQKINRGRRVAEEFIWESSAVTSKLNGKEEVQKEVGELVGKFRDKYRT